MSRSSEKWLVSRTHLDACIRSAMAERQAVGPVTTGNQVDFGLIKEPGEIRWDYTSTCRPASKILYAPFQDIVRLSDGTGAWQGVAAGPEPPRLLIGIHPCDLHGILVLDRTLLGAFKDPWYEAARRNTLIIGLNCQQVGETCFCASFGTGPFYHRWMGQGPPQCCDVLLTRLDDRFLAEPMSEAGRAFLGEPDLGEASSEHTEQAQSLEAKTLDKFQKVLDIRHLPEILLRNLEHPVWERVGEGRCLSCTNCTMVCPTCYCYDVVDETSMDLASGVRRRQWDSCQDQHFAEVHFGNYRATRKARLRQFVCHKLCYWVEQHGCFGCIGCGRCMYWCPTNIDLAEIATEIRQDETRR